jgi:hypothetical protein
MVQTILSATASIFFVALTYSFFWLPQIVRSARRGRGSGLSKEYLVGTTMCRLFIALCEYLDLVVDSSLLKKLQTSCSAQRMFSILNLDVSATLAAILFDKLTG